MKIKLVIISLFLFTIHCFGQRYLGYRSTNSGGVLSQEQASYDIQSYNIQLEIFPERKFIIGLTEVVSTVQIPMEWYVLDLDERMDVSKIEIKDKGHFKDAVFHRNGNKLWIHLNGSMSVGEQVVARISYSGMPLEAPAPPWVGGWTWAKTPSGKPWIATTGQFDGGDLWFPCKDHPSDEASTVQLTITYPDDLVLATNGVLEKQEALADGRKKETWVHNNPINNYTIALNLAPYKTKEITYQSITGEQFPIVFYFLPENEKTALEFFPQYPEHLKWYEETLGPYPFRKDKYGVVETPHLGMEHQTIVAVGRFKNNPFGYDDLHHHELSHEWWGNLVTAFDWRDFWIHEGFGAYMQALYNEAVGGEEAYHSFFERSRTLARNITTLAPRHTESVQERYFVAPEYIESDGDIYTKGALFLHTLRFLIGKEKLLEALKKFAYPLGNPVDDSCHCRFVTTDDFLAVINEVSEKDLSWAFEIYLRQPVLPELISTRTTDALYLKWKTPRNLDFPMPIEVMVDGSLVVVQMNEMEGNLRINEKSKVEIDPKNWVFKKTQTLDPSGWDFKKK